MRQAQTKYYNPYALGLYFQAMDRLDRYVARGDDLRLAMLHCFNGRLLDRLLKSANLPISTKDEAYVGGFDRLPELEEIE